MKKHCLTRILVKKVFLLAIVSMCNILIGSAQNNNALRVSLKLLQTPPEFQFSMDSTGFSKLAKPQFYSAIADTDVININPRNIHFVDFNNDGNKDIIYQDTQHYLATILFVNKDNDFKETWSGPGKLVEVKQGEETIIYVLKNAIGCDYSSQLIELIVHNDNTITQSSITYHYNTTIRDTNTVLKQKKISGILRTQPILDNKDKVDSCSGDLINGNQLKTIENKIVTIIKKQKNWLLVIYKEKDNSSIGWIRN
ncbi:hypothetical protein [Aquimarina macrocephali]|uniref:hypothetical protein n=1 Tax=Aquimarina macrocephali TaxID=666563 RepID=UPI0004B13992|nr:hypothetical protein [Aquimarina macrocephali]